MRSTPLLVVFALLVVAFSDGPAGATPYDPAAVDPGSAVFEGRNINLREGWAEAQACLVWDRDAVTECFRTEAELLDWGSQRGRRNGSRSRLGDRGAIFDLFDQSRQVLYLSQRSTWINLSNCGFSDRTSSYRVGACSS